MKSVFYLATKYLKIKSSDRGLSAIALIATLTIIISSAAAVVVLSIANGIHNNFMQKLMVRDAHVVVLGYGKGIPEYQSYVNAISNIPGVKSVYPYFEQQALMKGSLNTWGAAIMGVPTNYYDTDTDFRRQLLIEDGKFDLSRPFSIVLGYNLAINLGVRVGDPVLVTVYSDAAMGAQYRFIVAGTFSVGNKDFDSGLAFISFPDAQFLFEAPDLAYGIAVKVDKPFEVEKYMKPIREACPYYAANWKRLHRNDLAAIEDEKTFVQILLFFFFAVVAFNILSTMIGMVLDKKQEIGILKAMGLNPTKTMQVFVLDGFLLGVFGSLTGILLGLFIAIGFNDILRCFEILVDAVNYGGYYLVAWFKHLPHPEPFHIFNSDVYYIDKFPMLIQLGDLLFIMLSSVALSTLAVLYPAWTASKMRPVEVLRND